MSIQVIQRLRATTSSFSLPQLVFLGQVLSSTRARETCRFTYTVRADNVCFRGGSKTVERIQDVTRTATVIDHRLTLVACSGTATARPVELIQDIFDALQQRTRTRVDLRTVLGGE